MENEISWFRSVINNRIDEVKEHLKTIDVNILFGGITALMFASSRGYEEMVKLLLEQPGIDINRKNDDDSNALYLAVQSGSIGSREITKMLLKRPEIEIDPRIMFFRVMYKDVNDYYLQNVIIDNKREDIILFFDQYKLVHPKIKNENPQLFQASGWGLI